MTEWDYLRTLPLEEMAFVFAFWESFGDLYTVEEVLEERDGLSSIENDMIKYLSGSPKSEYNKGDNTRYDLFLNIDRPEVAVAILGYIYTTNAIFWEYESADIFYAYHRFMFGATTIDDVLRLHRKHYLEDEIYKILISEKEG
jgi:hypothetical protein